MNDRFDIQQALKASNWEQAKGYLRAMCAVQGAASGASEAYDKVCDEVEGFIRSIEDQELHL